jgi:hypothetical protein
MASPEKIAQDIQRNQQLVESSPGYALRSTREYGRLLQLAKKSKFCFEEQIWWKEDRKALEGKGFKSAEIEAALRSDLADRYRGGQQSPRRAKGNSWL